MSLQADPNNHSVYSNRSAIYMTLNEYSKALEDAESSVKIDPTFAKGHFRVASALDKLDRKADALESAQQGLKLAKEGEAALIKQLNELI